MPSRIRPMFAAAAVMALAAGLSACGTSTGRQIVGAGGGPAPTTKPATPAAAATPVDCPLIPGLPNTENGIFQLTAYGTGCATATALGRQALQTHQGKPFASGGFTCTSRYDTRGYPAWQYTCTAGAQRVTFAYSR